MKAIPTLLAAAIISSMAHAAAPAVGSISDNQEFAVRAGSGFKAANLDDYSGSILVLMMMTPWCPICQSHAQGVGDGILDHFNSDSRGDLRGKNDQGVPVRSLLLSTEEAATWDAVNASFSSTNGFDQWGLDADPVRRNQRQLLGYYRGGFIRSSNLYDWGNDRRRVVVLNLVDGSPSHAFREIILNQNAYSSGDNAAARAAINAIQPMRADPVPVLELEQGGSTLVSGTSTVAFGNVPPDGHTTLTFTLHSAGDAPLTGITAGITGEHASDFQVSGPDATTLEPGESTGFSIRFKPLARGTRQATLTLATSAAGSPPFVIDLSGTSNPPEPAIEVRQPKSRKLVYKKADRHFGSAAVGNKGRVLSFRIVNTGDAALDNLALSASGRHKKDFILLGPARTSLAPGGSTTFTATFMPRGRGPRNATLQIRSNDPEMGLFPVRLTGKGVRE